MKPKKGRPDRVESHVPKRICTTCKRRLILANFLAGGSLCKGCRPPPVVRDNDADSAEGVRRADAFIARMREVCGGIPPAPDYPDIADAPPMEPGFMLVRDTI